ncbi:diguanylate cyclase (GGDEF)-like protein [Sphingomonas kaistensis]|uniref:Diguanylate cyclase (GGDEF)-like protein n=1 Tax=Sphingomonas kaistensis TaxID=298708 RepID=A0A7X6BHC4_9SPHN|nr:EAL domain-containing protein [Sphingomonas kaistensis]NJC06818.1 diguanylate cyclase (GGDEF)-like protein [Sphingomonas kaistensis]
MKVGTAQKVSNILLSGLAGVASFVFSLYVFVTITQLPQQITAAVVAGAFCLVVCYIAAERPNSEGARALAALRDRLLAVEEGDLTSPAPEAVRRVMPKVAAAVDSLFAEVRSSIDNAQALGMYDPVTSLPNRLNFRAEAERLLARADGRTAAMLFVDLDRFKAVNDSLGHARGDQLLVMVANRLRVLINSEAAGAIRRPLLARLAGDEFTLFFPDVAGEPEAERIARRVVLAIGEPFELHGHSIDVGASVGLALGPRHGNSVEDLMRAADIAMYRAKSRGGHQHCLFSDTLAAEHQHRIDTEKALAVAVERGEFRLVLQPQLSLASGAVTGAEALLRWTHPVRGMVPPNQFISIAERTGIISEIGEWVMAEVAAMLASWSETDEGSKRVAFNVSPRQLERHDFFPKLRQIFAEAGVGLDRIEIEITETAAMECSQATLDEMAELRRDGATIALDDFGTGYSNIARLRQLPLDRIKLDQSLIHDITTSEQARNVVQAVIQLVRGVDCELVAEAVETVAQADILRTMGCETIQGYVFAEPMMEREFLAWTSHAISEDRSAA